MTPVQAIRAKCLDCCAGQPGEVKLCPMEDKCTLYPFRLGRNPNRKGTSNERSKQVLAEYNARKAADVNSAAEITSLTT